LLGEARGDRGAASESEPVPRKIQGALSTDKGCPLTRTGTKRRPVLFVRERVRFGCRGSRGRFACVSAARFAIRVPHTNTLTLSLTGPATREPDPRKVPA